MRDEDRVIDRVVEELKQAVRIDPALDARVMAAVARAPALGRGTGIAVLADWLLRTRTVAVRSTGTGARVRLLSWMIRTRTAEMRFRLAVATLSVGALNV